MTEMEEEISSSYFSCNIVTAIKSGWAGLVAFPEEIRNHTPLWFKTHPTHLGNSVAEGG